MGKNKKEVSVNIDPCSSGCKVENFKVLNNQITEYKNRKSIKIIYECVICGKKH